MTPDIGAKALNNNASTDGERVVTLNSLLEQQLTVRYRAGDISQPIVAALKPKARNAHTSLRTMIAN